MYRLSVAALSLSYHVALGSFASCTHQDTSSQCTTVLLLTTASYCLAVSTTTTSPSRPRTVEASHRRGEMARALGASNSYYCHLAVFLLRSWCSWRRALGALGALRRPLDGYYAHQLLASVWIPAQLLPRLPPLRYC